MKKILLLLAFFVGSAFAESVKISSVWGFAVGSTQGTYYRAILDQANKEQSKYEFVFENKPGAGGAIAAQYVNNQSPKVAILAHSPAFFVRPNLYPDTPYTFDQFKPLMVLGYAPAALVTKNKSLETLLKQDKITFGTAGTGSSTHLMAEAFVNEIKDRTKKDIVMVHYSNTIEAMTAVMGGHIDATFEYLGDARGRATSDTVLIGITGKDKVEGVSPLSSMGFKNMAAISGVIHIVTNASTSDATLTEIQTILLKAEKSPIVQAMYKRDYNSKDAYLQSPNDLSDWYKKKIELYKSITKDMKVK